MKKTILAATVAAAVLGAGAEMKKPAYLMIAGFGTVESVTQVDKWLGEQLQSNSNVDAQPVLSPEERALDPELASAVARLNWETRRTEYVMNAKALAEQNAKDRELLRSLRTRALTDSALRYVPLAKDYLQAALSERASGFFSVIDRSNADMNMVEQHLSGNDGSDILGASLILTASFGDREEESRTVTVNAKGTKIKTTTYTQPWQFKIRDTKGLVVLARTGTAQWTYRQNSVVASTMADPARKLVEQSCNQMADLIVQHFTSKLIFKVKVPAEFDADDAEIRVDGKMVDGESVRVFSVDHKVTAELSGCEPIECDIEFNGPAPEKIVKLKFRSAAAPAPAAPPAAAPAPNAAPAPAPAPAA